MRHAARAKLDDAFVAALQIREVRGPRFRCGIQVRQIPGIADSDLIAGWNSAAGEFAPLAMLQTAWPFESSSAEGASRDPAALDRAASDGRVTISLTDPDALSRAGKTVAVKTSALLSGTAQELTLAATASGVASKTLDLVLGDKDVDRALAGESRSGATELSVAGDDLMIGNGSMPASARARSSTRPAGPTNGNPARSSLSPGCSPTSIIDACRGPSPETA